MKIKTKLTLGVGLLFVLIMLLGAVSISYVNALKSDTESILVSNYNTLEYTRKILQELDTPGNLSVQRIEANLEKQEHTITEIGEKETTAQLRQHIQLWRSGNDSALQQARADIFRLMDMNMQAISRKSNLARHTAQNATFWIAITSTLCFLIAFTLLFNLPASISDPIKELTESIRQIASRQYSRRVHFKNSAEFTDLADSFNIMAEKLEVFTNSNLAGLMMEKKRIETLINKMNAPVIGLDEQLSVIFVNEVAVSITGLSQDQLIGHTVAELAAANDLLRSLTQELTTAPQPDDKPRQIRIYTGNKESYFEQEIIHISAVPTGETKSILIGHVIILRNVTQYRELDAAKTNFIATVSHEFKTPISSMKMSMQLLRNKQVGSLNEEQHKLIDSISDDTDRLLKITGELLNMTQVESGMMQLSVQPADPAAMLNLAVAATQTQADRKSIRFETDIAPQLPQVMADPEKTAWVLTNLIANAIRYSYENSIVYLGIRQDNHQVAFSVRDTGQGIAGKYKDKVFDKYFRVPDTQMEGTGLGLSISKSFVEAQGGRITVESEYGSGSTFTVYLDMSIGI